MTNRMTKQKYVVWRHHECRGVFTFSELKVWMMEHLPEHTAAINSCLRAYTKSNSKNSLSFYANMSEFCVIRPLSQQKCNHNDCKRIHTYEFRRVNLSENTEKVVNFYCTQHAEMKARVIQSYEKLFDLNVEIHPVYTRGTGKYYQETK